MDYEARWFVRTGGLAALLLVAGCGVTPIAGEECSVPNTGTCDNDGAALVCIGSTWTDINCRGPLGCSEQDSQFVCDQSLGRVGEACFTSSSATGACSTEGTAQLSCTGGTFQKVSDCVTCDITTTGQIACEQPCGPDTCDGCCSGNTCVTAVSAALCGIDGSTCNACSSGEICSEGTCSLDEGEACTSAEQCANAMTCFPEPVGSTSGGSCRVPCNAAAPDCASGFNCVDQGGSAGAACVPAPASTSTWKLRVTTGTIPATHPSGDSWDTIGQPDPVFCIFTTDNTICSGEATDTFAPTWNYTSTITLTHAELAASPSLLIWDNDSGTFTACEDSDTCIANGVGSVQPDQSIFSNAQNESDISPRWAGQPQQWRISGNNNLRIDFEFIPAP